MSKKMLELLIQKIKLTLQILQIQLAIKLLGQKKTVPNLPGPKFIIIHQEVGNSGFWGVDAWHKHCWGFKSSLGYYCGYQLYLDKEKRWWRARSDIEEGAHCPGHNKDSTGICVMGIYSPGQETLREDLGKELTKKVDELRAKYNIPRENVLGDKEGRIPSRPTSCPEGLMEWVENYRKVA